MVEEKQGEENRSPEEPLGEICRNLLDEIIQDASVERFEKTKQKLTDIFDKTYYIDAFARLDAEIDRQLRRFFDNLNNDPKFGETYEDVFNQKLPGIPIVNWLRKRKDINESLYQKIRDFKKARNKLVHDFEGNYPEFALYAEQNETPDVDINLFFDLTSEKWKELTQQQRGKVDEIREKLETEQGPTAEDEEFIEQTTRQLVEEKMEARLKELKTSLNQGLDCLQELINQKIQKVNT